MYSKYIEFACGTGRDNFVIIPAPDLRSYLANSILKRYDKFKCDIIGHIKWDENHLLKSWIGWISS